MIEIELRLYATLRRYRPGAPLEGGETVLLPEHSTIQDLIAALGIPAAEVQTAFVNRKVRALEQKLSAGDRVDLFPAIAGG